MLKNKYLLFLVLFILCSCQQVETLDTKSFNYNQLSKITITAEKKIITSKYKSNINDPYIDYFMEFPPSYYLNKWIDDNISAFGSENKLEINIIDASLKKSEVPNVGLKKYEEKTVFLFDLSFTAEFILYDNYDLVLSRSIVETNRTTTSGKYISINQSEIIINELIFDTLSDFATQSKETVSLHMKNFIL